MEMSCKETRVQSKYLRPLTSTQFPQRAENSEFTLIPFVLVVCMVA